MVGAWTFSCKFSYEYGKKWNRSIKWLRRKKAKRNTASKQRGNIMKKYLKDKRVWTVVAIAVISYWLWTTFNTVAAV